MCSKLTAIVLVFIGNSFMNGDSREIDLSNCARNLTTTNYEYTKTFSIEGIKNKNGIFMSFFVLAEKDAHIIFSPNEEPAKKGDKAYEIVLGSEKNTVSYIRKFRYEENVVTHIEENILSNKEWRQFWIRISSNGLIEVGKGNEKSAFMKWKGQPMPIKHFGFSSWDDNEVKWSFPCSENFDSNSEKVAEQKLKRELLSNYNTSAPPRNQTSAFNTGNITILGQNVTLIDDYIEIDGSVYISWEDERLSWDLEKYNLPSLNVTSHSIWVPHITIRNNSFPTSTSSDSNDVVTISHNGTVLQIIPLDTVTPACESPFKPPTTNKPMCLTKVALTASLEIIFEAYDDPTFDEESFSIFNPLKAPNSTEPDMHLTLIYHYQY